MVQHPESHYISHVTPESGSAKSIKQSIVTFLADKVDKKTIVFVGCDDANVNTGRMGVILRLLELDFSKPLQWFVCQLHLNEFPLRHLLVHFDGVTAGPREFDFPKLNFTASDYINLIEWQTLNITEPPVISTLSKANLEEFIASECVPALAFPRLPWHTHQLSAL